MSLFALVVETTESLCRKESRWHTFYSLRLWRSVYTLVTRRSSLFHHDADQILWPHRAFSKFEKMSRQNLLIEAQRRLSQACWSMEVRCVASILLHLSRLKSNNVAASCEFFIHTHYRYSILDRVNARTPSFSSEPSTGLEVKIFVTYFFLFLC